MQARTLTLLSFNCLWHTRARARLTALAPLLERSDARVVCLQEVVWRRNLALLRGLTPTFASADGGRNLGVGVKGGLVTLSRHPIDRTRFEVYRRRGRLRTVAFADWLLRKGFLMTWLLVGGQPVVVINTHLLANYDEDWTSGNDYAEQLRDELRQLTSAILAVGADSPVIVAGDLNVPVDSPLFEEFKMAAGLNDGFAGKHPPTARPASPALVAHTIDYVLVRVPDGSTCSITSRVLFDDAVVLPDGSRSRLSDHVAVESVIRLDASRW